MATYETLQQSPLVGAFKDLFRDLSDLVQKEARLARAEIKEAISSRLQAGVWMAAAGMAGFFALLFLLQAIAFGLAALGLGLGWSCLIVAAALAAAAAGAFLYGRALARGPIAPARALRQVKEDVRTIQEELT